MTTAIILMDIQMPLMDGYEATWRIRLEQPDLPIIALTANAMQEDLEQTRRVGMNEQLNKPIDVERLYAALMRYLPEQQSDASRHFESPPAAPDGLVPMGERVDTRAGLAHMGGNAGLYRKVLDSFVRDYAELRLDDLDDEESRRAVHTLKGLSANIGAVSLHEIAQRLEETRDRELLPALHAELEKVIAELTSTKWNAQADSGTAKPPMPDDLRETLISQLKAAIKSRRPKSCAPVIAQIDGYWLPEEERKALDEVKRLIGKYKFRDALEVLGQ